MIPPGSIEQMMPLGSLSGRVILSGINNLICPISLHTMLIYNYLSCTCSIWAVILHWIDNCSVNTVTDQDIVLLVPDSCRATVRSGNSIIVDFREQHRKTNRKTLVSALLRQFDRCFWIFWHCRICTIYVHYRKIYYSPAATSKHETGQKGT